MKKLLNKIAVWLYKKTKKESVESPFQMLNGYKLMVSHHVPPDTIFIGDKNYKSLSHSFLHQEITLKK